MFSLPLVSQFGQASSSTEVESLAFFGFLVIILLVVLIFYSLPLLISTWILYSKAGKPGWAAIIPLYNTYIFGVISKKPMWMVWTAIVLSLPFTNFLPDILATILGLAFLVIVLILLSGFVKQYDKGIGFWILYIFLPIIAVFLVKKANYIGGQQSGAISGISPAPVGPIPIQPPVSTPTNEIAAPQISTLPDPQQTNVQQSDESSQNTGAA